MSTLTATGSITTGDQASKVLEVQFLSDIPVSAHDGRFPILCL